MIGEGHMSKSIPWACSYLVSFANDVQAASAPRDLRIRLATSAVNPDTSPVIAKTHLPRVLAVVVSHPVVAAVTKNATR